MFWFFFFQTNEHCPSVGPKDSATPRFQRGTMIFPKLKSGHFTFLRKVLQRLKSQVLRTARRSPSLSPECHPTFLPRSRLAALWPSCAFWNMLTSLKSFAFAHLFVSLKRTQRSCGKFTLIPQVSSQQPPPVRPSLTILGAICATGRGLVRG